MYKYLGEIGRFVPRRLRFIARTVWEQLMILLKATSEPESVQ